MPKTKAFEKYSKEYDEWFENNYKLYEAELKLIRSFIKRNNNATLEIGVGTGKFAVPLDIKTGIEPCSQMARKAKEQGVCVISSVAEHLPFKDKTFDFILMVTTVCFVDDILLSFKEARRVLKDKGHFIVAYVDKDSFLGKQYELKKEKSKFYQEATFYGTEEILYYLNSAGFQSFVIKQTILNTDKIDLMKAGFGEGAFVAVLSSK